MKWYYIAIPVGLILAYLLFSSSSRISPIGTSTPAPSGIGGILTGIGNLLKGGGDAYASVAGEKDVSAD